MFIPKNNYNILKMKKLYVLFVVLVNILSTYAQDVITTKKGEDIQAKVLEITLKEIKYKKFDNPNSPVYTLLKSDVLLIRYENGSKDIFSEEKNQEKYEEKHPSLVNIIDRRYYIDGVKVSSSEVKRLIYKDEQAKKLWKKADGLRVGTVVFAGASCGFSLYSIFDSLEKIDKHRKGEYVDDKTNWTPLIVAAGLLVPALVFEIQSRNVRADAVETYNRNLQRKITLAPAIDGNGLGIAIRF